MDLERRFCCFDPGARWFRREDAVRRFSLPPAEHGVYSYRTGQVPAPHRTADAASNGRMLSPAAAETPASERPVSALRGRPTQVSRTGRPFPLLPVGSESRGCRGRRCAGQGLVLLVLRNVDAETALEDLVGANTQAGALYYTSLYLNQSKHNLLVDGGYRRATPSPPRKGETQSGPLGHGGNPLRAGSPGLLGELHRRVRQFSEIEHWPAAREALEAGVDRAVLVRVMRFAAYTNMHQALETLN